MATKPAKLRLVVERRFAQVAATDGGDFFTLHVRAIVGDDPLPPQYVEIQPDKRGGLAVQIDAPA